MTSPLIWIAFPLLIAVVLWFLQQKTSLAPGLATGLCIILALLAWLVPIGNAIKLGPWSLEIQPALVIFGRRFFLESSDRYFLVLVYGMGAFWFFGTNVAGTNRLFVPIGLAIIALLVAAMAVEPFLYAALLIELAVLLSVPMFVPPGAKSGQGVVRYLIFQTLALPFILLAGWAASGVEANPTDTKLQLQAVLLLALGFSFWLAIFPFYTWVPLLSQETHPYVSGFILTLLPTAVLLLMLNFLDNFSWLRSYPLLAQVLRLSGTLMVVTGGIWAAFQTNPLRLAGYAVIMESGFALLAVSLQNRIGLEIFAAAQFPRMLALALWALACSILIKEEPSMDFNGLKGRLHNYPVASSALLLAYFSMAGLPLLAEFSLRLALLVNLAQQSYLVIGWLSIGILGFLLSGFRMLSMFSTSEENTWQVKEKWPQVLLLGIGSMGLFLIGLFPKFFLSNFLALLQIFKHL